MLGLGLAEQFDQPIRFAFTGIREGAREWRERCSLADF
jgi:hypothetical protein